ncbi:MAG TPA: hypothetical protein VGN95_14270 [Pyrinomonadaceae bacterium]|nr:hypothetical protein [Pyrinomonadaceae bacterium]
MTAPIGSGWSGCRWDLHALESAAFARRTPQPDPISTRKPDTLRVTLCAHRTDAFVPAYAAALFVIDLMTAILLFAHRAFACAALALSGSREPIIGYGRIFRLKLPASM